LVTACGRSVGSEYIKSIVFGGLDGIITTFAIVAAVAGASLRVEVVLMMGFANLIADGISMGLGDYLSTKAEHDNIRQERAREAWEVENYEEGERREMINEYVELGFEKEDATTIIDTYLKKDKDGNLKYKNQFIDHMMIVELGQQVPDPDENPMWDGLITFTSFVFFGSVPMWFYVAFYAGGYHDAGGQFGIACAATALTMFLLGFTKARIVRATCCVSVTQGLLMMLNGSLAAGSAYLIGWGLEAAFGGTLSEAYGNK
jgi:vacuolar iron transporter family protein